MQKYIFLFLTFIICSCSIWVVEKTQTNENISSFRVFHVPHGFDVFYNSWATKSIMEYYTPWSIILNGSYFGTTEFGAYYPAGLWEWENIACCWLYLDNPHGTGVSISTTPNYDDPNLSHIVWTSSSWSILIFPRENLKRNAWPYKNAFQAWPLVLSGNILQDFWKSWHAHEAHERTLLWTTKSGKVYFFISTEKISLDNVWHEILATWQFQDDPITVVNLDGWPSTAYYDGLYWFRSDAKLPIIFRIKP